MKTVISYLFPPLCVVYTFGIMLGCAYLVDNTSFFRPFFSFFDDLGIGGIIGVALAIPFFLGALFLSTVPSSLTVDLLLIITGNKNEAKFTSEVL